MDINQLDFASHDIYCSHKCLSRSRNNDLTEALRAFTSHHLVQRILCFFWFMLYHLDNSRKKMQMTFPAAQSPMGFTAFIPPNPNPQFLQSLMVTGCLFITIILTSCFRPCSLSRRVTPSGDFTTSGRTSCQCPQVSAY